MSKMILYPEFQVEFDLDNFLKAVEESGIKKWCCEICNTELTAEKVIDNKNICDYLIFYCNKCKHRKPFIYMTTDAVRLVETDDNNENLQY